MHRIARFDKGAESVAIFNLAHAELDEFIDIALIIGEQDEALKMIGRGTAIMAKARQ